MKNENIVNNNDKGLKSKKKMSKKAKIILVTGIIVAIVAVIAVCFLMPLNGNKKEPEPSVSVDIVSRPPSEEDTSDRFDTILADRVQGSGKVPFSYSVSIPKGLKELESMDIKINKEGKIYYFEPDNKIIQLTKDDTFDIYNRVYEIKDKKCYLFISEYLGSMKFPYGAQLGIQQENMAEEVGDWIVTESLKAKFNFTPSMDISIKKRISLPGEKREMWNLFSDFRIAENKTNNKFYYKGVMATGYENPVFVWCVDLTEDNHYADDLELLINNIGHNLTFKSNKGE